MSTSADPSPHQPDVANPPPPRRRRLWLRLLIGAVIILLLLLIFLPNLIALPMFRTKLLNAGAQRFDCAATVGDLSLAWLSPVRMSDFKLQPDNTDRAALSVDSIAGDKLLLDLIFSRGLGSFRISRPELYVEFNDDGTNISRLLRALSGAAIIQKPLRLEIIDGRVLLRGKDAQQPWTIDQLTLNAQFIPSVQSGLGVSELRGGPAQLLRQMQLTPAMCDDLIKYVIPPLAQTTRTSGRISLEVEHFAWPLGKPELATVTGRITLHSVEAAPGPLTKSMIALISPNIASGSVEIANNDAVEFQMHDGRVYHENLVFTLAGVQVLSHGSVGFDESLDWSVEFQVHALEGVNTADHPILRALGQQKPKLHFTGTLSKPSWKIEGLTMPDLRAILDAVRKASASRESASQPTAPPKTAPLPQN